MHIFNHINAYKNLLHGYYFKVCLHSKRTYKNLISFLFLFEDPFYPKDFVIRV